MPDQTLSGARHHRPDGPSLAEIMKDPIVHLVMQRDGLTPDDVWPIMLDAQRRFQNRQCRVASRLSA